ncbi:MAG: T9SS type A sorting domain-containing protein, partial [Hymenobacteraceae bacterium]|nr:T9SS type A sorting domain-containing protein [Hymenobacteraceae bacterium]MDX5396351.1 T9SS type A sorting domain-containing protein [Hymenobacteraceae bacterium]MDX5442289.1 T9SS type A sorting domain-containing protein [Hymenobacteraceae bacterium]MDX5512412.1 T9SS type A sorting domain-containing protein [Hymenobacteraceae bacterium]
SSGIVWVEAGQLPVQKLEVRNSVGAVIVAESITDRAPAHELDLKALPSGLYFVLVYTDNGVATQKLLLNK